MINQNYIKPSAPPTGGDGYIQNQNSVYQPANFKILGDGEIWGSFFVTGSIKQSEVISSLIKTDVNGKLIPAISGTDFLVTETDPTVPSYAKSLTGFHVIKPSTDNLYEPIFSKNTAFNKNFGTASGTIAEGNDTRIINGQTAYSWGNHASAGYLTSILAASTYQPLDADLTSIGGLSGTIGLLKKTAANTWILDTNSYLTSFTETDPIFSAHTTKNIINGTGFLKNNGSGTWSYDNNIYLTTNSASTTYAPLLGGSNYIQNQNSTSQTANFRISGNGYIGGNVGIGDTNSNVTLYVGSLISGGNQNLISMQPSDTANPNRLLFARSVDNWTPVAIGQTHAGSYGGILTFQTHPSDGSKGDLSSPVERMRIDSNGNVGIGTMNPIARLQVDNGNILSIFRPATIGSRTTFFDHDYVMDIDNTAADGYIYTSGIGGTYPLNFYGEMIIQGNPRIGYNGGISLVTGTTNPSIKLRVAENGNVGIDTINPDRKLTVGGYIKVIDNGILFYNTINNKSWDISSSIQDLIIAESGIQEAIHLKSGGNIGLGISNPQERLHVDGSILSKFKTLSANPTTTDIPTGYTMVVKNTTDGALKLWTNDGGTLKSIQFN